MSYFLPRFLFFFFNSFVFSTNLEKKKGKAVLGEAHKASNESRANEMKGNGGSAAPSAQRVPASCSGRPPVAEQ